MKNSHKFRETRERFALIENVVSNASKWRMMTAYYSTWSSSESSKTDVGLFFLVQIQIHLSNICIENSFRCYYYIYVARIYFGVVAFVPVRVNKHVLVETRS